MSVSVFHLKTLMPFAGHHVYIMFINYKTTYTKFERPQFFIQLFTLLGFGNFSVK